MKRTKQLSMPQLPEDVQKEQEKLILSSGATAEEQLYVINHYLPMTRNLVENLTMLRHLGLKEDDIKEVLNGKLALISGEVVSLEHPTVKVVCSYARVSIGESDNGKYLVCINETPAEAYIHDERDRQAQMIKEMEENSKEDLMKEIKHLRREVKRLSERLRDTESYNEALKRLNDMNKGKR